MKPSGSLQARDARNRRYGEEVARRTIDGVARLDHDYNLYFEYGQSNREGAEAWPALSTVNLPGNLMYGADVRPSTGEGTFRPSGRPGFNPLIANVIDGKANPLSSEAIANLPVSAKNRGETPGIGAVNHLRLLTEQRQGEASRAHAIVLSNGAVGSMPIGALQRGHRSGRVEFYGRYLSLLSQTRGMAEAMGGSHQVLGIGWTQGEADYLDPPPSVGRASYKADLARIHRQMTEDAMTAGGNSAPPGFFMWQVGGSYTYNQDGDGRPDLFVGMATWEYARETHGAWLVGPTYPYKNKLRHLDANGARWSGLKEGQVLDRVINQRLDWEPLAPLAVESVGRSILVHYHVPAPPLRFAPVWRDGVKKDFATKGFRVTDASGPIRLTGVEIAAPTIVRLELEREPGDGALCWYADKVGYLPDGRLFHRGAGNLCDSDASDPLYTYEYTPGSPMYERSGIPELAGRPYDMANWAIAHCLPLNWFRPVRGGPG